MNTDQIIEFQGEVMLLGWADTSTRGRTITLQLSPEGESHPFSGAAVKNGKAAGARYMIVMVRLGEDEHPVVRHPSQICAQLCKDEMFQHFLNERSFVEVDSEDAARAHVLEACQIDSRSRLDTNPTARAAWEATIYKPWLTYKESLEKAHGVGV